MSQPPPTRGVEPAPGLRRACGRTARDEAAGRPRRLPRRPAFHRGSILDCTALLCTALVLLTACDEDRTGPEVPTYRITDGPACGDVVFVESLGADSAAAVDAMRARKAEKYGEITVELHRLEVVDRHGDVPGGQVLRALLPGSGKRRFRVRS